MIWCGDINIGDGARVGWGGVGGYEGGPSRGRAAFPRQWAVVGRLAGSAHRSPPSVAARTSISPLTLPRFLAHPQRYNIYNIIYYIILYLFSSPYYSFFWSCIKNAYFTFSLSFRCASGGRGWRRREAAGRRWGGRWTSALGSWCYPR